MFGLKPGFLLKAPKVANTSIANASAGASQDEQLAKKKAKVDHLSLSANESPVISTGKKALADPFVISDRASSSSSAANLEAQGTISLPPTLGVDLTALSQQKFAETLGRIDPKYRFHGYIDVKFVMQAQEPRADFFDNDRYQDGKLILGEPGYSQAMEKALLFLKDNIYTHLTPSFIIELHKIANQAVKWFFPSECPQSADYGGGRREAICGLHGLKDKPNYGFDYRLATKDALKEMEELGTLISVPGYHSVSRPSREKCRFVLMPTPIVDSADPSLTYELRVKESAALRNPELYNETFKRISSYSVILTSYWQADENGRTFVDMERTLINDIEQYHNDLQKAGGQRTKILEVIVNFCRLLEMRHFFIDGNQRMIVFLLLPKLLLANNIDPCFMYDPTLFDGYRGTGEMKEIVEVGQEIFKIIANKYPLSGATSKITLPEPDDTAAKIAACVVTYGGMDISLPTEKEKAKQTLQDFLNNLPPEKKTEVTRLLKLISL